MTPSTNPEKGPYEFVTKDAVENMWGAPQKMVARKLMAERDAALEVAAEYYDQLPDRFGDGTIEATAQVRSILEAANAKS